MSNLFYCCMARSGWQPDVQHSTSTVSYDMAQTHANAW